VGDDDLLQSEFVAGEQGEDLRNVVAGIDDQGLAGGLIAEDRAVALQRSHGKRFEDHGSVWRKRLLLCRSALRRARQHRMVVRGLALLKDGETDGGDDEDHGQPGGGFGEHVGGGAGTERGLRTLSTEGGGQIGALALLQQDDKDQRQADDDVDAGKKDDHGVSLEPRSVPLRGGKKLWCGRGDLNPHAFRRHPLKMVCLPISPLPLCALSITKGFVG
jgi:hypothetical protein